MILFLFSSPAIISRPDQQLRENRDSERPQTLSSSGPANLQGGSSDLSTNCIVDVRNLIGCLGLQSHFPGQINIQQVMKISSENTLQASDDALSTNVLRYLKRIIMLDSSTRDNFDEILNSTICPSDALASESSGSDSDSPDACPSMSILPTVHPLDYFLLVFLCCNRLLRQVVCEKLFACGRAVPISYPTFRDSQDHLEVMLFPLKSIILEWRNNDQGFEQDAASAACHFVSFCRIGEAEGHGKSKSQIINGILSEVPHDRFFYYDCPHADPVKRISNGVVEGSWYIPRGKDSDVFPHPTMFLNLRGNCLKYDNQMVLLSGLSSVVVMMVDTSFLNENSTLCFLTEAVSRCKAVILLIDHNMLPIEETVHICLKAFEQRKPTKNGNLDIMHTFSRSKANHKNATKIRKELRLKIKEKCCNCATERSFKDSLQNIVPKIDVMTTDEENILGKTQADDVFKTVANESVTNLAQHVPLQGDLWQEWSQLLKKSNRPNTQVGDPMINIQKIQAEMKQIRDKQYACCLKPSNLIKAFMDALLCGDTGASHGKDILEERIQYFIAYLKLHFDALSRKNLPELNQKYQECWKQSNQEVELEVLKQLQRKVKQAERMLEKASFGVEHLFRELGQMYEAVQQKPETEKMIKKIKQLPKIMATLVLAGQPLELMDGDAKNVPLSWVQAVLSEITTKIPRKKIFVICVLGVQSSGKTTLLNTMFGLQFAVSAGRCTRGVYMQLVPVDDNTSLPYDYVCIVDTEGLRALELQSDDVLSPVHHRDNELATLVIGLGDLTIMNVKGENYTDMQDIIQISVQAFLRMKTVSITDKNQHRCMFIHQNVPATSATEKMRQACQKLQENLDKRTRGAAEHEHIKGIEKFNQMIMFDCHRDVFFFPDLWQGDPPMVHANPGYSARVIDIRQNIFSDITSNFDNNGFMAFDDLSQRLRDLWKGILADDFVFSFRNGIELKAYSGLERKFQQLLIHLEEKVFEWEKATESTIGSFVSDLASDIKDEKAGLEESLTAHMNNVKLELLDELKDFFKHYDYRRHVTAWEESKLNSLRLAVEKRTNSAMESLTESITKREGEIFRENENAIHMEEILQKACALAADMKSPECAKEKPKEAFERMWNRWIRGRDVEKAPGKTNGQIHDAIMHCIHQRLSSDLHCVRSETRKKPINDTLDYKLENMIEDISEDKIPADLFSFERTYISRMKTFYKTHHRIVAEYAPKAIEQIKETSLKTAYNYLQNLPKSSRFKEHLVFTLIGHVLNTLQDQTFVLENKVSVICKPALLAILVVHVCRYAYPILCNMQRKHDEDRSYQEYKTTLWNVFNNKCNERGDEYIAAQYFLDHVKARVDMHVKMCALFAVKLDILKLYQTKEQLIRNILFDLSKKEDEFGRYLDYIHNPKHLAALWLLQTTMQRLNSWSNGRREISRKIADLISERVGEIGECLVSTKEASKHLEIEKMTMIEWRDLFCEHAREALGAIPAHYPIEKAQKSFEKSGDKTFVINDIKYFENLIVNGVHDIERNLKQEYNMADRNVPADIGLNSVVIQGIIDSRWGCSEVCPFCKEPCINSEEGHKGRHKCMQHRPIGIGGFTGESEDLVLYTCGYAISNASCLYSLPGSGTECTRVKYKDYPKLHPNWDIPPDPTMSDLSIYWIWFMTAYKEKLSEHYTATFPQIPALWERLNAEQARQSLTPNGDAELQDIIDQISIDYMVRKKPAICAAPSTVDPATTQASTAIKSTPSRKWRMCTIV